MAQIKVTQTRSSISTKPKHRGTLRALSRERNRRGLGPDHADEGLLAEGALGPEVGDHQRLLERDRGRHDLTVNRPQCLVPDRAVVLPRNFTQHGVLALRHVNLTARTALHLANLRRQRQPLVQQLHQLVVNVVDLLANGCKVHVSSS